MDNKPDITDIYKEMFGGTEDGMPCFPYTECFANAEEAHIKDVHVEELYLRRFTKPCSLVVIHPSVESISVYADAYTHQQDHFRFDETMPNCDFEMIPKNVPVLMIGPGDRTGVLADNYKYSTPIRDMRYLVNQPIIVNTLRR